MSEGGQVAGKIGQDLPDPPAGLSESAEKLWNSAVADYHFNAAELGLLESGCRAWTRGEQARHVVEREGLTVVSGSGMAHEHPAVKIERASMIEFRQVWRSLALIDPSAGADKR